MPSPPNIIDNETFVLSIQLIYNGIQIINLQSLIIGDRQIGSERDCNNTLDLILCLIISTLVIYDYSNILLTLLCSITRYNSLKQIAVKQTNNSE